MKSLLLSPCGLTKMHLTTRFLATLCYIYTGFSLSFINVNPVFAISKKSENSPTKINRNTSFLVSQKINGYKFRSIYKLSNGKFLSTISYVGCKKKYVLPLEKQKVDEYSNANLNALNIISILTKNQAKFLSEKDITLYIVELSNYYQKMWLQDADRAIDCNSSSKLIVDIPHPQVTYEDSSIEFSKNTSFSPISETDKSVLVYCGNGSTYDISDFGLDQGTCTGPIPPGYPGYNVAFSTLEDSYKSGLNVPVIRSKTWPDLAGYRLVYIFRPEKLFNSAQVEDIKNFINRGGRIVIFGGPTDGGYGSQGIRVTNKLLQDLDVPIIHNDDYYDDIDTLPCRITNNYGQHQVTNNLSSNGINYGETATLSLGNDAALLIGRSSNASQAIMGAYPKKRETAGDVVVVSAEGVLTNEGGCSQPPNSQLFYNLYSYSIDVISPLLISTPPSNSPLPKECQGFSLCGYPGDEVKAKFQYPACSTSDCGLETWMASNLPESVKDYKFNPATTNGSSVTELTTNLSYNKSIPGNYVYKIIADCSGTVTCLSAGFGYKILYFEQAIPEIMHNLGWSVSERFMNRWLSAKAFIISSGTYTEKLKDFENRGGGSIENISMDWLLNFSSTNSKYKILLDKLMRGAQLTYIFPTKSYVNLAEKISSLIQGKSSIDYGDFTKIGSALHDQSIDYVTVSNPSVSNPRLNDLLGSFGNFQLSAIPHVKAVNASGIVTFTIDKFGIYAIDSYDFLEKDQILGCWARPNTVFYQFIYRCYEHGYNASNETFRTFQDKTLKGGDFIVMSNVKEETVTINCSFPLSNTSGVKCRVNASKKQ